MHILFLTDNFPPEVNAPASRTFEHCKEWVAAGHTVTVVTSNPNFPKGKLYPGHRNRLVQKEEMAGIKVVRVWTYMTANEGFFKRVLDQVSYMITAFFAGLFVRKVDLIIGTSPQFFTVCAAYGLAVLKRRPWVFELRDIWPESIRALGAMRESRILDFLEKVELFLYRKATAIVSVTKAFKADLVRRGIDGDKISIVTNGVDVSRFSPRSKDEKLTNDLGLKGKFIVGYIGTHGMAHALGTVLDAAALIQDKPGFEDVRFLFLGHGAEKAGLVQRAQGEGLENVLFLDSVSKHEVPRYWSLLDISLINLRRIDLFKTVIPSKLFESMGMGIPVLLGVEGESRDILEEEGVGLAFEPESPDALMASLEVLRTDQGLYEAFRAKGPVAARNYDRKILAARMLDKLEEVAET